MQHKSYNLNSLPEKNPTFPWHTAGEILRHGTAKPSELPQGMCGGAPRSVPWWGWWQRLILYISYEIHGRKGLVGWLVSQYLGDFLIEHVIIVGKTIPVPYGSGNFRRPWVFGHFRWGSLWVWDLDLRQEKNQVGSCIFMVGRHDIPWYMRGISMKASLMWYVLDTIATKISPLT